MYSLDVGGRDADTQTVENAWLLFESLALNCDIFARRVNFLTIVSLTLAMITTTLSVCLTYIQTEDGTAWASNFAKTQYYATGGYAYCTRINKHI